MCNVYNRWHRTMCAFFQRTLEKVKKKRISLNERMNEWMNERKELKSIVRKKLTNKQHLTEIDWPNNEPAQCSYPIIIYLFKPFWLIRSSTHHCHWQTDNIHTHVKKTRSSNRKNLTILHIIFRAIALDYYCNWKRSRFDDDARAI